MAQFSKDLAQAATDKIFATARGDPARLWTTVLPKTEGHLHCHRSACTLAQSALALGHLAHGCSGLLLLASVQPSTKYAMLQERAPAGCEASVPWH